MEVACLHDDGRTISARRFEAQETASMTAFLRGSCGPEVRVVMDSTTGVVDGLLLAAGFRVLRADPGVLPPRPVAGSVPAPVLAAVAHRAPDRLVELDTESGTLKGRTREVFEAVRRSADTARRLAGSGHFLKQGPPGRRTIALTFDDGPSTEHTEHVLDILRDFEVVATFFCVGLNVRGLPRLVARMAEEGHTVGIHTWSHPILSDLSRDEFLFQLDETVRVISGATGDSPRLVRPPYGCRTDDTLRWTAGHGLVTVLWDRDSRDWTMPGETAIVETVRRGVSDGSVVLMHDGGGDRRQTVAALPTLLTALLDDSYEPVTVEDMLAVPEGGLSARAGDREQL
ncbi:polysaccharide deacetylase family protein [Streptomyces jumonjinensis]|uniref:polysaccharide deacetylase family protein n=1 Tax=Streptomyces jumonjinensis TaxID=1945 RepID=UPI00379607E1